MRYFNLFSNILITKGISRILISDLQRNISELYHLELYEIIEELKINSIENILQNYDQESQKVLWEYIDFLLENEYGFITENDWNHNFPSLSFEYHDYNKISDLFIELGNIDILYKIQASIESLEIRYLIIYSQINFPLEDFLKIDQLFSHTPLENIEIYSPFHSDINLAFVENLENNTSRISNLTFYSCNNVPFKTRKNFRFIIHFSPENLKIFSCGKVDIKHFNTNLPKVLEALNHNSCLHKKIGIDINGNIKNCPLMPESYGNINNSSLEDALAKPDFKRYWNLTKDGIEICKDCEFRYVCTDCRAYTERTHTDKNRLDISKPLKCGYNPYTTKWEDWAKNPLKHKAIKYYNIKNSSFKPTTKK
ncbi:grasp-with-spasm system SPASM domain peptide maturase [Chryseobacterium sp. MEBOG06]|uniref:grasp-with-spasm system SPASM domain peptide maturase n=1 Tax=Chryseobacterium sp. MEBOG06 TaxID=2879938 RepID=UPI001F023771|nr:grasp-with-spasm system SPASM domain peptide maturase [Chryseobacterium sp. MEBOG06]UKB84598.1 grasp-with-spasm system SPASM domain peptide maturase [Chryseobacterium sp. MEBOG06]